MYKTTSTLIICLLFGICSVIQGQVRIAVSKTYSSYEAWLKRAEPSVEIINMYGRKIDSVAIILKTCSGLLLTGGEDVNPARYGKGNELSKCEEIDDYRDSLEFALIKRAVELKMPIFGICRGEQILNVALGGTLLTDIPSDVGTTVIHRSASTSGSPHLIIIDKKSDLFRLIGVKQDTVNSYHHQAIDKIAPGFRISAKSENGVAEAMERVSPGVKPFIMAVQWHPEKSTQKAELSKPLGDYYLKHAREYSKSKK